MEFEKKILLFQHNNLNNPSSSTESNRNTLKKVNKVFSILFKTTFEIDLLGQTKLWHQLK